MRVRRSRLLERLSGGDRRSIGASDKIVAEVLGNPSLFEDLFQGLFDEDTLIRMRAADAVEKITQRHPDWLTPYKSTLLDDIAASEQQEVRWHVAQMLPKLHLVGREQAIAVRILKRYLKDESSIVKTFALQALADLSQENSTLRKQVIHLVKNSLRVGTPAMKSRARKILKQFDQIGRR
jgi:HEAT repeat protein